MRAAPAPMRGERRAAEIRSPTLRVGFGFEAPTRRVRLHPRRVDSFLPLAKPGCCHRMAARRGKQPLRAAQATPPADGVPASDGSPCAL